jgi:hypothetical protein
MAMDFDVTGGSITMRVIPPTIGNPPTVSTGMVGTFSLTVDSLDGHIGESDSVSIDGVDLTNTGTMQTVLISVATANILAGSVHFTDFTTLAPGHIGPGGVANPTGGAYLEATILVVGALATTFSTATWTPPEAATVLITTSAMASENVTAALQFHFAYPIGVSEMGATLTLDFVVDVVGTAHVPEPALGSLVALGLGGAGAWLRRRRG